MNLRCTSQNSLQKPLTEKQSTIFSSWKETKTFLIWLSLWGKGITEQQSRLDSSPSFTCCCVLPVTWLTEGCYLLPLSCSEGRWFLSFEISNLCAKLVWNCVYLHARLLRCDSLMLYQRQAQLPSKLLLPGLEVECPSDASAERVVKPKHVQREQNATRSVSYTDSFEINLWRNKKRRFHSFVCSKTTSSAPWNEIKTYFWYSN